jgi:hypothetical protein
LEVEEEEEKGGWRRKKEEAAPPPRCGAGFATDCCRTEILNEQGPSFETISSNLGPTIIQMRNPLVNLKNGGPVTQIT